MLNKLLEHRLQGARFPCFDRLASVLVISALSLHSAALWRIGFSPSIYLQSRVIKTVDKNEQQICTVLKVFRVASVADPSGMAALSPKDAVLEPWVCSSVSELKMDVDICADGQIPGQGQWENFGRLYT
ncbi:hypothetical protein BGX24_012264 [Mortierella sp. AD032]|nr:hypothetical protein BGX24_012264 [Mortierella sp. AD032]